MLIEFNLENIKRDKGRCFMLRKEIVQFIKRIGNNIQLCIWLYRLEIYKVKFVGNIREIDTEMDLNIFFLEISQ